MLRLIMIESFRSASTCAVEVLDKGLWRSILRTDDNLFSGEVSLDVKAPALEIRQARLTVLRDALGATPDLTTASEKLIGVRVGPGMTQIVRGLVAKEAGSQRFAEMVLDAMEMLINALTVGELRKASEQYGLPAEIPGDGPGIRLNNVLIGLEHVKIMAENPRLRESCVAFRDL
jgi:hypothetical protein